LLNGTATCYSILCENAVFASLESYQAQSFFNSTRSVQKCQRTNEKKHGISVSNPTKLTNACSCLDLGYVYFPIRSELHCDGTVTL